MLREQHVLTLTRSDLVTTAELIHSVLLTEGNRTSKQVLMPLAFHILAHKNPKQICRLINAIWAPENLYVLHYDQRRPRQEHQEIGAFIKNLHNVIIQSPRPVLWGRFSLLRAQLEGLKIALESGREWTHWINISGQCFPLHSPGKLSAILAADTDTSFVNGYDPLSTSHWPNAHQRLDNIAFDSPVLEWILARPWLGRRLRRFFGWGPIPVRRRRNPKEPAPFERWYGGDNWVMLSRAAAKQAVAPENAPLIKWFSDTLLPEESYFQTLLMNRERQLPRKGDHRREILWHPGHISPSIFRLEHMDRLESAAQRGRLFARKFDMAVDSAVIDAIEQRLLRQT